MKDDTANCDLNLLEHLEFASDSGATARARIGLIVLASDHTIEHEWQAIFAQLQGVGLFHARILNEDTVTPETLRAMEPRITACAETLLPGTGLDVIAYGCTSATMAIGEARVFECIRKAKPGVACTTPATAAFAAFNAFGARRIAVLTPYRSDVNRLVAKHITDGGFEVPVFGSFNEPSDAKVSCISPDSIKSAVRRLAAATEADAVFISCTSVRIAREIESLEKEVNLPVTSSNHAMAWHAARLAGIDDVVDGYGRLFSLTL